MHFPAMRLLLVALAAVAQVSIPRSIYSPVEHQLLNISYNASENYNSEIESASATYLQASSSSNNNKKKGGKDQPPIVVKFDIGDTSNGESRAIGSVKIGGIPRVVIFDTVSNDPILLKQSSTMDVDMAAEHVEIGTVNLSNMAGLLHVRDNDKIPPLLKVGDDRGALYDGIVGLGPRAVNQPYGVASQIYHKKTGLVERLFSLYISPDGLDGEILFGGIDSDLHTGEINYYGIEAQRTGNNGKQQRVSDWRLPFDGITLGTKRIVPKKFVARLENNYKYGIYSSRGLELSASILEMTPGAERLDNGRVVIDCGKREHLLPLHLDFKNGGKLSFTGEQYFPFRNEEGRAGKTLGQYCELFVQDHGGDYDDGDEQQANAVYSLGMPVMQAYYTVFDLKLNRVGFSPSASSTSKNVMEEKKKVQRQGASSPPPSSTTGDTTPSPSTMKKKKRWWKKRPKWWTKMKKNRKDKKKNGDENVNVNENENENERSERKKRASWWTKMMKKNRKDEEK